MARTIRNPNRSLAALDFSKLFEAGFAADSAASKLLHKNFKAGPDGVERWYWWASALAGCTREQILKRAGMATDPTPLNSEITFEFGHSMHRKAEKFAELGREVFGNDFDLIGAEIGGPDPTMPLTARADMLFSFGGGLVIWDLKTESAFSQRIRTEEAKGKTSSVKADHIGQLAAGAVVLHHRAAQTLPSRVMPMLPIQHGLVTYVSKVEGKNEWTWDTQYTPITQADRDAVPARVQELEDAWAKYEATGELPPRMPEEYSTYRNRMECYWKCRPVGPKDSNGKFCNARSACMSLPPDLIKLEVLPK